MPSLPADTTPEAERQRIIDDLKQEEAGPAQPDAKAPAAKPAVPPKPAAPAAAKGCDAETLVAAAAVPPLRGTLHGEFRPADESTAAPAQAAAPSGVTGALPPEKPGTLVLRFAEGLSDLNAADRERIHAVATDFVLQGGTNVTVRARGGATMGSDRPQALASLSLGMERASKIAGALIAEGVGADKISIAAQGDEAAPGFAAADWSAAGPDGAVIVFSPIAP